MEFFESNRSNINQFCMSWVTEEMIMPAHMHTSLELIYVIEGQIKITIDKVPKILNQNEMVMFFPNQIHSYETVDHSKYYICIFSPDLINTFVRKIKNKTQKNPIFTLDHDYIIPNLIRCNVKDILELKSYLYAICAEFEKKVTLVDKPTVNDDLKLQIIDYIQTNFNRNITLKEISEKLGYDYYYISKYFTKNFAVNFQTFFSMYRIDNAKYLLLETDKSITEIGFLCGFDSIRTFNRAFHKVANCSPSIFRKEFYQKEE